MSDAAIPLLETKLHVPRRRRGIVPRPRLRERLERHDHAALMLVSAPAGFGKTTFLADCFADRPSTAWLSLDRHDNEPTVFWTYVVAALQRVEPAVGADALELVRTPQAAMDAVVATLLNDLHAVDHDLVLAIDDYHLIDAIEIHEAMSFLIERLPPNVHVVIATRADPPLPLASVRARGELLEYRASDLRFTPEEATAYLNDSMGLAVDQAGIDVLDARAEGWIAALQLAALSMQDRDDVDAFIARFAGDDRFVLDYLIAEVLARQDEDVRRFLLDTAILDRLTGPLCDAVTGGTGGRAMLDELDRSNLFVVALDDQRAWYRYHHLFADVLRAQLLDEDADRVRELHRRASDWYGANGDRESAVAHAMAGNAYDRAAELIELAAPHLRRTRQDTTLRRWLEAVPDELLGDRPVLCIALVGARMVTGDTAGVADLLELAEAGVERTTPPPIVFDAEEFARLPSQVAVYRAALALLVGDVDGTILHANRALDLAESSHHLTRGSAGALLGLAHWSMGDLDPAAQRYAEAIENLEAAGHVSDVLGCSLALADIQIARGHLREATGTFETGLRHTVANRGVRGAADMHVGLSQVLIQRNELDAAERQLQTSAELGPSAELPQNAYRWRVAMAWLRAARGDVDGAIELLDEAEPLYNTDFSPAVQPVAARKVRVLLARGDVRPGERWATDRGLRPDDELSYVREYEHITLARILLARETDEDRLRGIDLLDRLLVAAETGKRDASAMEILALLALAHWDRHDTTAATAALTGALVRAEPDGYVRLFLDEGPAMMALLGSVELQGGAGEHARRVLAAAEQTGPAAPARTGLFEDLSARELDVLRLLRSDLSGPDIARELLVSLNTLRTHTKNIYAKLGVNNRREAVRRAEELGL